MTDKEHIIHNESDVKTLPHLTWAKIQPAPGSKTPLARVGHGSCYFIKQHVIYMVGGANPNIDEGAFSDVWSLDLTTFQYKEESKSGLKPRYEHATWVDEDRNQLYVFGGAHKDGNRKNIQVYDLLKKTWKNQSSKGPEPSARTHHSAAVLSMYIKNFTLLLLFLNV